MYAVKAKKWSKMYQKVRFSINVWKCHLCHKLVHYPTKSLLVVFWPWHQSSRKTKNTLNTWCLLNVNNNQHYTLGACFANPYVIALSFHAKPLFRSYHYKMSSITQMQISVFQCATETPLGSVMAKEWTVKSVQGLSTRVPARSHMHRRIMTWL